MPRIKEKQAIYDEAVKRIMATETIEEEWGKALADAAIFGQKPDKDEWKIGYLEMVEENIGKKECFDAIVAEVENAPLYLADAFGLSEKAITEENNL